MVTFAWPVHHNVLVEPLSEPIEGRIAYIQDMKARSEHKLRLRLLKPVKGRLPEAYIGAAKEVFHARQQPYDTPHRWQAIEHADLRLQRARRVGAIAIDKLHEQECPDCPWDSKRQTIFPVGYISR